MWPIRIFAVCAVLCGAGCTFQPLYEQDTRGDVASQLAQIKVALIPDRMGQILRNFLLDRFNPYGEPTSPTHELVISLKENPSELSLRKDYSARRQQLSYAGQVELRRLPGRQLVYKDTIDTIVSFSIGSLAATASLPYVTSEEKARERAMEMIAKDVSFMLASFLKGQGLKS